MYNQNEMKSLNTMPCGGLEATDDELVTLWGRLCYYSHEQTCPKNDSTITELSFDRLNIHLNPLVVWLDDDNPERSRFEQSQVVFCGVEDITFTRETRLLNSGTPMNESIINIHCKNGDTHRICWRAFQS